MSTIGIVAIGRNEGPRLPACLQSALGASGAVVYVDSGSTDTSVQLARDLGAAVVELDLSIPFTAARARNEGFSQLLKLAPDTAFVQFVDGDCEIAAGWLKAAADTLAADNRLAVVCGRRRERSPEASLYNKLVDIEWNTPVGPAKSCGGDAMFRVAAFREAGGFDAAIIAGEEPELCFRLRQKEWTIQRIDHEMTLHDAAMTSFVQWWKRNVRAGHAYAQGAHLHGHSPEHYNIRSTRSNWVWGLMLPLGIVIAATLTRGFGLLLLAMYPLLGARVAGRALRRNGLAHCAQLRRLHRPGKIPPDARPTQIHGRAPARPQIAHH